MHYINRILIGYTAVTSLYSDAQTSHEAPALQLQEHAAAVLEDDRRCGVQRDDPVLQRLARARKEHAVPWRRSYMAIAA